MPNMNIEVKDILFTALTTQKNVSGLYNTYANEVSNPQIKTELMTILSETHDSQFRTFEELHKRGFYPTPKADDTKIVAVKDKFKKYR